MTKGAQAFRDLARLRRGSSPRGGRPDHRQGAPGRRPPSLPTRRETQGRGNPQGVRRGPASPGRRRGRVARAATGQGLGSHGLHAASDSGQVATGVQRRPGALTLAGSPTAPSLQAASWSKGVTQTGCIFPPQPRPAASPNFLLDLSLSLFSFDVPKEDAAAQPRWLPVPPTHPVSRAAAGWRNPPRATGLVDGRFGAPGQVGGSLRPTRKAGAG